jgi:hypothetical protein
MFNYYTAVEGVVDKDTAGCCDTEEEGREEVVDCIEEVDQRVEEVFHILEAEEADCTQ